MILDLFYKVYLYLGVKVLDPLMYYNGKYDVMYYNGKYDVLHHIIYHHLESH